MLFELDKEIQDQGVVKGQKNSYHNQFSKFLKFQSQIFTKLLKVQEKNNLDSAVILRDEGYLVQFACGHRGQPSRIEEKRVSRLLRRSGFIPKLEEAKPVVQVNVNASSGTSKTNFSKDV